MKKNEKGILTVEASIVLTLFTLFVLFIFNFASIYTAQNVVSHATIQAADAVAIESYLRETAEEGDTADVVNLASQITDSSSISADSFESLRTAELPDVAREKFVSAISNSESTTNEKLEALGVQNGLSGVDFNSSYVDLENDDVIVAVTYILDLKFPVFGAEEVVLTKTAKAKTFGDILYGVTTKPNNPEWGVTSGDDEVEQGETVVITATPNHGYRFVSWNDGVTDNPRTVLVTEAKKYVAIFEKSGYGINLSVNNADWGTTTGSGTYDYMSTATITATPKQHYQFIGWDYNGDGVVDHTGPTRNIVVNKTYYIKAIFEPVTYTITVKSNNTAYGNALATNAEGVSGTTIPAKYGSYVTLTATTTNSSYYEFEKWSNGSNQSVTSVQVTGNATYTANFKLSTYSVNFYNGSSLYSTVLVYKNSSVAGSGKSMPDTSSLSNFARWKTSTGSTFSANTTVSSDMNVYAAFNCMVTLNLNGGVYNKSKNNIVKTIEKGSAFNFDNYTPSKEGYKFNGWGSYSGSVTINSDIIATASWSCKHSLGFSNSTLHQLACRGVHGGEPAKCKKCQKDCRSSVGAKNSYYLKTCNTCGEKVIQEDETQNFHYGVDGYAYATTRPMEYADYDDFWAACSSTAHTVDWNKECYGNGTYNPAHAWGSYRHILCSHCHNFEQPPRDTNGAINGYTYKRVYWCGTHLDSNRKTYKCPY